MDKNAVFYIATNGDDRNEGSPERPFRTLSGARDALRQRGEEQDRDIVVYLRGGVYEIDSPIEFGPQDSGNNGCSIRYAAYPGEAPIISGGTKVGGWEPHEGNIVKARLERAGKLRQLYVDGRRVGMARGKTFGYAQIIGEYGEYSVSGDEAWALDGGKVAAGIEVARELLPLCGNAADVEICGRAGFGFHTVSLGDIIQGNNPHSAAAIFAQPMGAIAQSVPIKWGAGFLSNVPELNAVGEYYFQNAYEFLTEPGHFYFDRKERTLYYYKREHEEMERLEVIAPLSEGLLKIKGVSTRNRVANLAFTGLTFAHSHWSMMEAGSSYADTAVQSVCLYTRYKQDGDMHEVDYRILRNQGAAIEVENATGIEFSGNQIRNIGAIGIAYGNDTTYSRIEENDFRDTGSSAIHVGDARHVYIGDGDFPPEVEGLCENLLIKGNVLADSAALSKQASALSVVFGRDIEIDSNRIENCPYTGISLGWGWVKYISVRTDKPTTSLGNNTISNNTLLNVCHSMHDGGAIYILGEQPNSQIVGNIVEGSGGASDGNAIYLDQGTAYFLVEGNKCRAYNGSWLYVWGEEAMVRHIKVINNEADQITGLEGDYLHDSEFTNARLID